MDLEQVIAAVATADSQAREAVQRQLDNKTKPLGSLGRLEELAGRIGAIQRTPTPCVSKKTLVIMAADHGVAQEGVSAYPQQVTAQMLGNFCNGGAAINALARQFHADLLLVDMGTINPPPLRPTCASMRTLSASLGQGTGNLARGPAMARHTAIQALKSGIRIADMLNASGADIIGLGEMGIGNTTSASALAAAFTGQSVDSLTGRGTGIDEAARHRKVATIERALALHNPDPTDPVGVLAQLGGFEIAGLAGIALGAAAHRIPIVADGFVSSAAVLAAMRLTPALADYIITSHQSVEPGHRAILADIGHKPLLDMEMRLGEGTGAILAMGLVESAVRILNEMASFTEAKIAVASA